ncbi:MAG TPA: hypothetical protein VK149_12380 [Sideroxyarcus sp.]|nr:hypothetical protein [Sideroxyarcus sp.]
MGLEQALTFGLLGAVGGGAGVIHEQEKAARENAAKRADEQAKSDRESAIEERRAARNFSNQKELLGIQHQNALELEAAKNKSPEGKAKAVEASAKAEKAKHEIEDENRVRNEIKQHENNIRGWQAKISEDPSTRSVLMPSIEDAQARITELRSGGTATSTRVEQEEGMLPKQVVEQKGKTAPSLLYSPRQAEKQDKFVVGKQYKDANGNVATYRGNGQWE